MKVFTSNLKQNALRLSILSWVLYAFYEAFSNAYSKFPLVPSTSFFGIELAEPSSIAAFLTLAMALFLTLLITTCPPLLLWAKLEDRYWPNTTKTL